MSQKGDKQALTPDELQQKIAETRKKVADSAAELVTERAKEPLKAEAEAKKSILKTGVEQARKMVRGYEQAARGVGQVKFWCIVHLNNGTRFLHEAHWKINEVPTAGEMLKEKAVLGEYNPRAIARIQIFKTLEEAEKEAKVWADMDKEDKEQKDMAMAKAIAQAVAQVSKESKK